MKPEFSAAQTPLEKGFTVIEASAGTGKTTTISAIVLRLLVEQGIPIEQILVATYTELATAELRGRIRDTILDALTSQNLPFVQEIIKKATDRKQFERKLKLALQSFDEAPIFTIHSFCGRILADRAFESGVLFETELVTDQSRFVHEVADDFWRAHFYSDDSIMAGLVRERLTPARLVELLVQLTNNPSFRVSPPSENRAALEKKITELCRASRKPEAISQLAARVIVSLQSECSEWARKELRRRKTDRRVQSFDDMLRRLDEALRGTRGNELRKILRERFTVALA